LKANNFTNNLFANKVAENQINKFTRPEFLSASNKFKNLIQQSEQKNKEEQDKFDKKDLHQDKLNEQIDKERSVEQDGMFELFASHRQVDNVDLLNTKDSELTLEQKNIKNQLLGR